MIGSLIGSALGIGASIFGGIKASQAMKDAKSNLEQQRRDNQNWYDRRYNEDATQRADAQRILTQTAEAIKQRNKAASGTAAVMGGNAESVAAEKAANAQAMADAASRIAVAGEARKDNIEQQYQQRDQALQGQLNNMEVARANAVTQAAAGVAGAAGSTGNAVDQLLMDDKKIAAELEKARIAAGK